MSSTPSVPRPPEIPDHELLCLIGSGSYGEVWLACNAIGTPRAVKIVHRQSFQRAEHFEREFKGLLKFEPISRSHDGLIDILQIGRRDDAGYFFYVMELADDPASNPKSETRNPNSTGTANQRTIRTSGFGLHSDSGPRNSDLYSPLTLRSELQTRGRLPPATCIALGLRLASALEHLHASGLVHRDIKPSNIIFVNSEPKLADIGLVTAIDEAHSLVGTVGYIPPEGPGTPQADLYSLGKVVYEIALGKDLQDFPQLPPDLQSHPDYAALLELNEVILKACETDPRHRYASAAALREDLIRLQQGRSVKRRRTMERRLGFVKNYGFATAAIILFVAGAWRLSNRFEGASEPPSPTAPVLVEVKSIAVLPFDNESPDSADEYLGTQMAEELASAIRTLPALRVLAWDSAAAVKSSKDYRAAARELKLGALLTGTVLKTTNELRVSAQLINTTDDSLLWSKVYAGPMSAIFGIQTDIAEKVAERLKLKLTETVRQRLAIRSTKNLEAYQFYLEGRNYWNRRVEADVKRAIELFRQAIAQDTNCSAAWSGLADCYARSAQQGWLPPQTAWLEAEAAAQKAVMLDPALSEAHASVAFIRENHDWDWAGAEREFQRALELDRNNVTARSWYGIHLGRLGRYGETVLEAKRAQELDPQSGLRCWVLGRLLTASRRYDEAIEQFQESLRLNPNYFSRLNSLGDCYLYKARYEEAIAAFEKGAIGAGQEPQSAALREAYEASGAEGYWRKSLELAKAKWKEGDDPVRMALIYAWLGERDLAFEWLEKEQRAPDLINLNLTPAWNPLRADKRFKALLKNVGLEK